jgi:hypothetical protein
MRIGTHHGNGVRNAISFLPQESAIDGQAKVLSGDEKARQGWIVGRVKWVSLLPEADARECNKETYLCREGTHSRPRGT